MNDEKKHPGGRPTVYTDELAKEICDVIAITPKGLKPLCNENQHWPDERTIRYWIRNKEEFFHMYAQAKLDQADVLAEECLEIADYADRDTIFIEKDGYEKEVCNHEWVNRSRLRVDTRKWLASKLAPRLYGDRVHNEHSGSINTNPLDEIPLEKQKAAFIAAANAIGNNESSDDSEGSAK